MIVVVIAFRAFTGSPIVVSLLGGVLLLTAWLLGACGSIGSKLPDLTPVAEEARQAASSATIAISSEGARVYTVNSDAGSITAIDATTDRLLWELPVGAEPRSIALDPRGARAYVSDFVGGTVSVVDLNDATVLVTFTTASRPYGIVVSPGGRVLYVAESGAHAVALFDTGTLERLATVAVEENPRGLAISSDGTRLYVTHFLSGHVSVIDVDSREVVDIVSTGAESNAAQFIAIAPAGGKAYLPHIRSRVSNANLQFDTTIAPLVSVIDLDANRLLRKELLGLDAIDQPVNMPFAVAFSPDGRLIYVVNSGSNDLSIVDLETGLGTGHIEVGDNPRGIVLTGDATRAYVRNALSDDVSVLDLVSLTEISRIPVTESPLPPEVRRGKALFFSSDRPELARDQWVSCASCHLDGLNDGRTWPFDDGPRNTPVILGLADSAPFHWSGDRIDLFDFQKTIIDVQGGTGISDEETTDLAAFLGFGDFAPSSAPLADDSPTSAAALGQELFDAAGCAACHSGDALTDRLLHDVGTGVDPRETRGSAFDTPSLLGIRDSAPYLHDGRATTLHELLTILNIDDGHGVTSNLTDEQLDALVAYLRSLP
ncbi:MAG TPA: beta-propeller fold lactonase family protein [Acidobacteriota bacterium]|nr:beta-propeller fold lactonase family protein [Acidobacteriota bacterium]